MNDILGSAFVVCLDEYQPDNFINMSKALFHGGAHGELLGNRWYVFLDTQRLNLLNFNP